MQGSWRCSTLPAARVVVHVTPRVTMRVTPTPKNLNGTAGLPLLAGHICGPSCDQTQCLWVSPSLYPHIPASLPVRCMPHTSADSIRSLTRATVLRQCFSPQLSAQGSRILHCQCETISVVLLLVDNSSNQASSFVQGVPGCSVHFSCPQCVMRIRSARNDVQHPRPSS
jgi:hypothetical protein